MTMPPSATGRLVIVSGPSGAGKTTVLRRVFEAATAPLLPSVSATTRPPRPGEIDGVDYHFLSEQEFNARCARGEFLESFEVFARGYWYGTLKTEVASGLGAGKWVVLEIDVHGAAAVMEQYPSAISIFVQPSSIEELKRRLRGRGTETEEAIRRRLAQANEELRFAHRYRHQVINDDMDHAVQEICDILNREAEADRDAR